MEIMETNNEISMRKYESNFRRTEFLGVLNGK